MLTCALLLAAVLSEPLAPRHTTEAPSRISTVLPAGRHAVLACEGSKVLTLDPATGKHTTTDLPLERGFTLLAAGDALVAYDRTTLVGLVPEGKGCKIAWKQRYVATAETGDPSDNVRIARVACSADTIAVVDTSGKFALLNVRDGKVAWHAEVPAGENYFIAAGGRCGAVLWETEHETYAHAIDIYLEPFRENRRACGMMGVLAAGMTTEGVVFSTPDRVGLVSFDGRLRRAPIRKQTRVDGTHVTSDESYGSLLWSVGKKGMCVTPVPEETPFVVNTPKQDWETLWVTDNGMFASNATHLAEWVAANEARPFRAAGRPAHPRRMADVLYAVAADGSRYTLCSWDQQGKRVVRELKIGPSKPDGFCWVGGSLVGYAGQRAMVFPVEPDKKKEGK